MGEERVSAWLELSFVRQLDTDNLATIGQDVEGSS
jgi:hypothetical protein